MPVSVGGVRGGPDPETLLQALADLWVEAVERGRELRGLEGRVGRQEAWLAGNSAHPLYPARIHQAVVVRSERDRIERTVHELAAKANRLTEVMDGETKTRAQRDIHEWAAIGSPGVYGIAWNVIPDKAWLEDAEDAR